MLLRRPPMLLALASLLLACGGDGHARSFPSEGASEPARVGVLPTTTTGAVRTAPSRFEFVDYAVVGGIAGLNDSLKIYPDGRAVYRSGERVVDFSVAPATVDALRSALERADLPSLPPVDITAVGSADLRAHRVIFGGRAVRFHDGSMPPALGPAMEILERELARARSMR